MPWNTEMAKKAFEEYKAMVKNPGKFEGAHPATPYFWELAMESMGETDFIDDTEFTFFTIDVEESEVFDIPHGWNYVVWEDSLGFVYGAWYETKKETEEKINSWLGN